MALGAPQADYKYTWFFTGRQLDAGGNGTQFVGEVVVCDGRPFGFDALPNSIALAPAGETVVEAIFGARRACLRNSVASRPTGPVTAPLERHRMPDPQVRVGGWICDVTYERAVRPTSVAGSQLAPPALVSLARCNWYQVGKRTDPQPEHVHRRLGLPVDGADADLAGPKVQTLLTSDGSPVHVNVALVMPSVINVFPRSFETIPIHTPWRSPE